MPSEIAPSLTEDGLLNGRVRLLQPANGYRAAIDPVLLAAAVGARTGDKILDLGCGAGAAALCLLARLPDVSVTGLELQIHMAELARRNAGLNGVEARFSVMEGSAAAPPVTLSGFDHVMTNPPFFAESSGTAPKAESRAISHMEGGLDLRGWIKAGLRLLRPKGRLTLIHRAERLGDILAALAGGGVGGIVVFPIWPKPGRPAGRIIVSVRKGVRSPLEMRPGIILHHGDGRYTGEAEAILREGGALDLPAAAGG